MKLNESIKKVLIKEDINDVQKAFVAFKEFDTQEAEDFFEKLAELYDDLSHNPYGKKDNWSSTITRSAVEERRLKAEFYTKLSELCDKARELHGKYDPRN